MFQFSTQGGLRDRNDASLRVEIHVHTGCMAPNVLRCNNDKLF